jgi:lipoate---protein ligase
MKYLDLTLPTPEANLACDEALLDFCEDVVCEPVLRFWEPQNYFVVLGYANSVAAEVNAAACAAKNVPVLRRCSGGGTVLQGAGCLNYSLILKIEAGPLLSIPATNRFVMNAHREALQVILDGPIEVRGHTDLAIGQRKFSGNAQRRRKNFLIFHGTFLLNFDLSLVEELLRFPSKAPTYRQNRSHLEFLMNVERSTAEIKETLKNVWKAAEPYDVVPFDRINRLMKTKYSTDEWNLKF